MNDTHIEQPTTQEEPTEQEEVKEEPTAEPTEEQTEPPAPKRKPRGRPPPPAGEDEPLRPRLRDKTTCPDCNKQISMHALRYTHSRVCAAKRKQELVLEEVGAEQPAPKAKAKAAPKVEVAKPTEPQDILREYAEIAGTQPPAAQPDKKAMVMDYIKELKQKHLQEKQQRYKTLLTGKI
jgi:hypothetical protein